MVVKILWFSIFGGVLAWSAIAPADRYTWWLEVAPALIALGLLVYTRKKFPLTSLAYSLILVHSIILMIGGHYTYAQVPLFDWLWELLGNTRNNYDKIGHLAQGFIPAIIAREILIRKQVLAKPGWLNFLIVCIILAISAFYELLEWWVALLSSEAAESFLGTQGYVWDTQSDMLMALVGAILALVLLSRLHDRPLSRLMAA